MKCLKRYTVSKKLTLRARYLVLLFLLIAGCGHRQQRDLQTHEYIVGAHYYLWFPKNFKLGYLRACLSPPQTPVAGIYDSSDIHVVEQHISLCSRYGIDFLTLDWWPDRPEQNRLVADSFLKARNIADIKFCIFYETWALGFDKTFGTTLFDRDTSSRFIHDLLNISNEFFNHPSYLRVNDRPVLLLYLSRTFSGEYKQAIKRLRRRLKERGFSAFIIGDEIFWKVTPANQEERGKSPLTAEPQLERIHCFDAITSYNMYENGRKSHKGYGKTSAHIADVTAKYKEYRDATAGKAYFVPQIMPGYNDSGVRVKKNHYAIPRQWQQGGPEGSFFAHAFDKLALSFLDNRLNMMLITSWNEWNEDTAIEPLKPSPPTKSDFTGTNVFYTEGYTYEGYGTTYLEVLRSKVCSVTGRVQNGAGEPRGKVLVTASKDGLIIASRRTDMNGYYRLSRLKMPPGHYKIAVQTSRSRDVIITSAQTVTNINFTLQQEQTK